MPNTSRTKTASKTRLQSRDAPRSGIKKSGYLDVVFSDAYPIASGAETGGRGIYPGNPSPTSVRNDTYFSEEKHVKITTLSKISTISSEICDILKHALATHSWQCRGSGQLQLLPNHHNGFLRMPKDIIADKKHKIQQFFYFSPIFV